MKGVVSRLVVGASFGKYSTWGLVCLVIACLVSLSTSAMAQPIDRQYWVNIHTQGAAWALRINDLHVQSHSTTEYYSISYPISVNLTEGANTVSFIYAPLLEDEAGNLLQDTETGELMQGPKDNFFVNVTIEAINTQTQAKEGIHTLQLRYDMETGELIDFPKNPANVIGETVHQSEHLRTRGEFQVNSPAQLLNGSGQSLEAERVDMSFRLLDTIPDFHWVNDATPLQDTPRLRHELRQAYQRLHGLFEEGNSDAIVREFEPVWERAGLLMAGGKSARDYIESMPIGSQLVGIHQEPDGPRLQPLDFADTPAEDSLEFMGEGRLVRIVPSPIYWAYPNQPDKEEDVMPMVFYRTSSGDWRIADVDS
ncbi:hypothetical protein [Vreelandella zhanjiangensis]|uniref:hypothetical protein n=1 Tax=Vreelandella zhanjiangensis TaxID=1121960 RepID=UPI0003A26692|nr:hypothetical protein [Halomonas zhanjiangensis]